MKIENINGMIKITAEENKCLIRKGEEQKLEDNNTQIVYLAKSLSPDDYEEKDLMENPLKDDFMMEEKREDLTWQI
nr:MAG TPA: hypothetical protein [Caudoviricetes sp.]